MKCKGNIKTFWKAILLTVAILGFFLGIGWIVYKFENGFIIILITVGVFFVFAMSYLMVSDGMGPPPRPER